MRQALTWACSSWGGQRRHSHPRRRLLQKDADGTVTAFEYDDLDDVLEFGFADVDGEAGGVLNDEDLGLAETLEPNSSAALIVWEHRWAARVAQAIRDAGRRIVAGERIPHEIVERALPETATS